jgi:hypothetical protein
MTTIVRLNDDIYFDNLVLLASHAGGFISTTKDKHKLFKHPSYPVVIGISGAMTATDFQSVEAWVNQTITSLNEDINTPVNIEALNEIKDFRNLMTLGIYSKDYTFVINNAGNGEKWETFKYTPNRLMIIGSGTSTMKVLTEEDFQSQVENALEVVSRMDTFTTATWNHFDINELIGETK